MIGQRAEQVERRIKKRANLYVTP